MPSTTLHHLQRPGQPIVRPTADGIAMQQLRHLTKNALQRVIGQIATSDLSATPAGRTLADELETRICLSARLSDALFGLQSAPAPLPARLAQLTETTIAVFAESGQAIRTEITVAGTCPSVLETVVVRVAHEMLGNAVKHGLHGRREGRIAVRVRVDAGVTLLVSDDGAGPGDINSGEGMPIMRLLAEQHGGSVALYREADWTVARLHLPEPDTAPNLTLSRR